MEKPQLILNHSHYDIFCGYSNYYMDKISGEPLKTLSNHLVFQTEGNNYVLKYKSYNSFEYDSQGRIIRFKQICKRTQNQPGELILRHWKWNDNNEIIFYKDNNGNHYDKAWGIHNPYTNKYPTDLIKQLKRHYKSNMENTKISQGNYQVRNYELDVSYTQSQG